MLKSSETTKPNTNFMKSNKSRITLTLIAIALLIFGLSQCQSKDSEGTATVETKNSSDKKASEPASSKSSEPVSSKKDQPAPAKTQPKSAEKSEKPAPAPGLPPEHRPIF